MRPVVFIGSAREDLRSFPDEVREDVGHALYLVQIGETPVDSKPLQGFGVGVQEIREVGEGGTYRAVYTVALPTAVYVLHAFQKEIPTRARDCPRGSGVNSLTPSLGAAGQRRTPERGIRPWTGNGKSCPAAAISLPI